MGFLKNLFQKLNKSGEKSQDWEIPQYRQEGVNFRDEEQRSRYVMGCLEQIAEAERETERLTEEYAQVTSYLADTEEIEALPELEMKQLEKNARMIRSLERGIEDFLGRKDRMSDSQYHALRIQEQTVADGIEKLREAEEHSGRIRQDLKKLDVERQAHAFRRRELDSMCENYRGMAVIFMAALLLCLGMLAVLRFAFRMNIYAGFFIAVTAAALAVIIVCIKYLDAQRELRKIRRAESRLIQLQNTVKIRYVNNTNLLEYLYLKYNTDSARKLAELWELYQKEKEDRRQFAEAQDQIEQCQAHLAAQLKRYRLKNPERWMDQTAAILDSREMVEIRHELIQRRQALRKQLDYNKTIAQAAHREIMDISDRYPAYRSEILDMVDKYRQDSEILL